MEMGAIMEMANKMYHNATISQSLVDKKYKCPECKDTGWICVDEENNMFSKCECMKKEHITKLWQGFGVNPHTVKKINDYKAYDSLTSSAKDKAIEYVKNFDSIKNSDENSFGMFGKAGAGKSHIIIAIAAALLNREKYVHVIYMPYIEAVRELKANVNDDEYYLRLISKYQKAELLVIDDLFKDKIKNGQLHRNNGYNTGLSEADMKHIYPIINYRYYNNLPTLVSTECTPEMLVELDEALAGRILERCGENISIFYDDKYDYRLRKFI